MNGYEVRLKQPIELQLISASSAEQPSIIHLIKLIDAYEEHKKSKAYVEARSQSTKHQVSQRRLTGQVWWAQYNYSKGRKLSEMVRDDEVDFFQLPEWEQKLVEDYDYRRLAKALDEVLEQKAFKQQPYRGAGTETTGCER